MRVSYPKRAASVNTRPETDYGKIASMPRESGRRAGSPPASRSAAFCLLAAFIILSPAYKSVFQMPGDFLRSWDMYAVRRTNLCMVSYRLRTPAGEERRAPIFELLREGKPPGIAHVEREMRYPEEALARAKPFCERLGTPSPDLRVYMTCPRGRDWHVELAGEDNICLGEESR